MMCGPLDAMCEEGASDALLLGLWGDGDQIDCGGTWCRQKCGCCAIEAEAGETDGALVLCGDKCDVCAIALDGVAEPFAVEGVST